LFVSKMLVSISSSSRFLLEGVVFFALLIENSFIQKKKEKKLTLKRFGLYRL